MELARSITEVTSNTQLVNALCDRGIIASCIDDSFGDYINIWGDCGENNEEVIFTISPLWDNEDEPTRIYGWRMDEVGNQGRGFYQDEQIDIELLLDLIEETLEGEGYARNDATLEEIKIALEMRGILAEIIEDGFNQITPHLDIEGGAFTLHENLNRLGNTPTQGFYVQTRERYQVGTIPNLDTITVTDNLLRLIGTHYLVNLD